MTPTLAETFRSRPAFCAGVIEMPVVCLFSFARNIVRSKPVVGDMAAGHGMSRRVAAVPSWQPLEQDAVWRVILHGERVVRVVAYATRQGLSWRWQLLRMDDMTDKQLDAYEAALCDRDVDSQGTEDLKRQA